jgi:hypothetical protein
MFQIGDWRIQSADFGNLMRPVMNASSAEEFFLRMP